MVELMGPKIAIIWVGGTSAPAKSRTLPEMDVKVIRLKRSCSRERSQHSDELNIWPQVKKHFCKANS